MESMLEQKHRALLQEAGRSANASTANIRAVFEVLALAGAIDRECAARLAPYRLSEGRFVVLFLLFGAPGGLSAHALASRAGVTRATVTGLLDGLERDGFVIRRPDPDDRRKIAVILTEPGRTTAYQVFGEHTLWVASLFRGFSSDERRILKSLLQRIWSNLQSSLPRDGDDEEVHP